VLWKKTKNGFQNNETFFVLNLVYLPTGTTFGSTTAHLFMDLIIRISKKGTRVVRATELHRALGLADHHYQANVRNWLKDVYQFADGIRRPVGMQDFARSTRTKGQLVQEYYLNLEFARLVALSTKSKVKQAVATKLSKEEAVYPDRVQLTADQMMELLEQTRAMTRFTCQEAAEQRHLQTFIRRTGSADYWNRYRVEHLTGTTVEQLRRRAEDRKIPYTRSLRVRELLLRVDPLECLRIGILDHYAAQGYSIPYASELARLAREMATTMKLEVTDNRKGDGLFTAPADVEIVRELQRVAA
jgi:phage anti-repressor protein